MKLYDVGLFVFLLSLFGPDAVNAVLDEATKSPPAQTQPAEPAAPDKGQDGQK